MRERTARADFAVCALLMLVVITHLVVRWPHDLNGVDESQYLYEAKRLLDGDVLYRDIFEIVTPVAFWAMAIVFHVFGATFMTARAAMAVVHALITALVYLTCRTLGVRRAVSVLAAGAY